MEDGAEPEAEHSGDADAATDADADAGESPAEGGRTVAPAAAAADSAKADGEAAADSESTTSAAAETADTPDEAEASADTDTDTDTDAEDEAEDDGDTAAEGDTDAGTDAAGEAEAETDTGTETPADASADTDSDTAAEGDTDAGTDAAGDTEPEAETDTGTETPADASADTDSDTAAEGDTDAGTDAAGDTEPEAETDSPDADTDAESDTEAEDDSDTAPEDEPGDRVRKDSASASVGTEDADAKIADAKTTDADTDAEGEGEGEGTDAAERAEDPRVPKDSASDAPPVDQPTAVFKAPRPSAPAVDQPTTMLKFGGAGTAEKSQEADKGREPEQRPVPEAERTSKFVALKPLDDPATRKPKAADATTALPRVQRTPDVTSPVPQVGPERTTQQPLPPKPPLDLLAELTNTPPPPDTPVRTAIRRVKIWTPLVLLLAVVFAVAQAARPLPTPELQLTAEDSYTFQGAKGDLPWPADGQAALDVQGIGSFGSSGEQRPVPIASVAKVMTAYLILRDHPLKSGAAGPKIPIDQAAQDQSKAGQESTVDVTKGDSLSQREALQSILIASANNVARLLARWDAGSEKAFVSKMNAAAKDLGMTNTTYTDPSGLNNTTVSTAVDQVKLAKAAMTEPAFREVAAMMSYDDYKGVNHSNWNQLVGKNDVVGIKTGTTTSALGNLVFAAKKEVGGETRTIVGAVVRQPAGGPENTILSAALDSGDKLIRAAQGELKSATILKKGDVVGYADDGLGGRTPVVATKDVTAVGWAGLTVKLTFAADDLPHTAKAGTQVGSLTVGDGSGSAVKVPVALQQDLVEPGFTDKLTRLG
ncbi:D-alanyl-D-alanine carboxypeptidase [Streptomyces cellulosae]|uniref:serine-type D-Ala-D-Ala carboxypeptidase n=1 Tax=Streptomyces cellulosae TaxID=1968 RepID=A0ABW7Y3I1_STRCE